MATTDTSHFVNFTKACDYYKSHVIDELTPAELGRTVQHLIDEGEIYLGKPELEVGDRLVLIDEGTRYGIER
jgi:hypothetical protein